MSITINPSATIAPPSSFLVDTQGYTQGLTLDDPVARQWLRSGPVDSSVTQAIWGGMAIQELVQSPGSNAAGGSIGLATTAAEITGFSVFDRAYNMIVSPGNTVPTTSTGMSVAYYRLGSNARIPVLCTAALITAVEGNGTNTAVLWDAVNSQLVPSGTSGGLALTCQVVAVNSNSKIVAYNSSTKAVTWTTGSVAVIQI